jgi:hypothetical protein
MGFVDHDVMRYHFTQLFGFKNAAANSVTVMFYYWPKRSLFDRLQFVGQIFGIDAIAYQNNCVLKQTVVAPKRVHLVAIDLVKASLISMPRTL